MLALVTRPVIDAQPLAEALAARGVDVVVEPLLEIVPVPDPSLSLDGVQGVLATSANGIRALAANTSRRDVPVWAVGAATAGEARRLGFARIDTAEGDVVALADRVIARADRTAGALLHAAGNHIAGDLAGRLGAAGFEVRRAVLYEARPAEALSPELRACLAARQIDVAFFFSPRTAKTFVTLVRAVGQDAGCDAITVYAFSPAVARELDLLVWAGVRTMARPTQEALLAAFDADRAARSGKG